MSDIKPGDVVRLKSGSEHMTVESIMAGVAYVIAEREGALIQSLVSLVALEIAAPTEVDVKAMIG